MIHLWEKPVNVLPMGNPVADYLFLLFIYYHADSVMPNADLVFPRKPSQLLKVSQIERILTYEILEDELLCLSLDTLRKVGKFLQKALFVFNFPHLVSKSHRNV